VPFRVARVSQGKPLLDESWLTSSLCAPAGHKESALRAQVRPSLLLLHAGERLWLTCNCPS
jgi:hypothetical protein